VAEKPVQPAVQKKNDPAPDPHPPDVSTELALEPHELQKIWKQVLHDLEDMTGDFASAATSLAISAPNTLVVGFPAHYTLQKESCERPERREKIEFLLAELTGHKVHLKFELLPDEAADAAEPVARSNRRKKQDLEQDPLVRQAMDVFDAELIRVEANPADGT
jgi:DNA polymerase-3 subunit gamma/tau